MLRTRLLAGAFLALSTALPATALAQDLPPDRNPAEQGPVADPASALGACGSETTVLTNGNTTTNIQPADTQDANKNVVGERQLNLSAVRGTIVHTEGNLMLIQVTPSAATQPAPGGTASTPSLAVVQLPAACMPVPFSEGSGIVAVGTPNNGILAAESVQPI